MAEVCRHCRVCRPMNSIGVALTGFPCRILGAWGKFAHSYDDKPYSQRTAAKESKIHAGWATLAVVMWSWGRATGGANANKGVSTAPLRPSQATWYHSTIHGSSRGTMAGHESGTVHKRGTCGPIEVHVNALGAHCVGERRERLDKGPGPGCQ